MNPLAILSWLGKIGGLISGINFGAIIPTLQAVGQNIVKYWQYWLIGLLFLANGFTGYELKHARDSLKTEITAHAQDIKNFKDAQAAADANAQAIKDKLTQESRANADQADSNYSVLLSKYRASILRFQAGQSHSGSTGSDLGPATEGSNGPGTSSIFPKAITISGEDADICTVNTARLQAVHDWAIALPKDK